MGAGTVTLLREIQDAAQDSQVPLPDLLRRCKVLAARLRHKDFAEWVDHELNGYNSDDDVPAYRKLAVQSLGHFSGPFGSAIKNAQIPVMKLPEEFRHFATEQVFAGPIAELIGFAASEDGTLQGKWPGDLIGYVQHHVPIYDSMVLADAWRMIPVALVHGILDTIRTRVLDFALKIEEIEPTAGEVPPGQPPRVPSDQVTYIYNTVIHNGQANIGTSGNATIAGNAVYSSKIPTKQREALDKLFIRLRKEASNLDEPDLAEASETLVKVEEQLRAPIPRPERASKYLEVYANIVQVTTPTYLALKAIIDQLSAML